MKRKSFIYIIILFISFIPNIVFGNSLTTYQSAEENGRMIGELTGGLSGQRDYINNQKSDWEKAHKEEEKRIISLYSLENETSTNRFYFLKGFREGFKVGYEKSYKTSAEQNNLSTFDLGNIHGSFFGALMGETYGIKESQAGKTNNWKRTVPTDKELISEFSLNRDSTRYADSFIIAFKTAYEESYTNAFRNANFRNHMLTKEMGLIHGADAGKNQGKALGQMDYVNGKNNNWKSALPTDQQIILQASLLKENSQYREGFLSGYIEGFKEGYIEAFQNANMSTVLNNINYIEVSMMGATIISPDNMLTLSIQPGTFYWDTFFTLEKGLQPIYYLDTGRLEAVTNKYSIGVSNIFGRITLKEPMTLTFTYHGSDKAGIYQFIDNQWQYLYSEFKDNTISTVIPAGSYTGGTYAIFIDERYPELKDIYTHWASQEIYTYVRRSYVFGYPDYTFKPTEKVTRGEFVALLGRVLKWTTPTNSGLNVDFIDAREFGVNRNSIVNAVTKGYIKGYEDNTFKPNNLITYQEIEWIIQRIPMNQDFKWAQIEEKMLYEKYTRSQSRFGLNHHITRGEIVYMLHELQKEGKI